MDATKILADTLIPASSVDQILKMESTASLVITSVVELGSAPKSELRENFNLTIIEIMGNVLNKDSTEVPEIDQFYTLCLFLAEINKRLFNDHSSPSRRSRSRE